jgi:hypothetical protein
MSAWKEESSRFFQVLSAWEAHSRKDAIDATVPADAYRGNFTTLQATAVRKELDNFEGRRNDADVEYVYGCFTPSPVTGIDGPALYPVIRFGFGKRDGRPDANIRVVAYFEEAGTVHAFGWRYELPDKGADHGDRFHHFPHVQAISSWEKIQEGEANHGLHAPDWYQPEAYPELNKQLILENRPAFPLPCTGLAGAMVCVIVSLYGSNRARRILEEYVGMPADFAAQVSRIIGIDL